MEGNGVGDITATAPQYRDVKFTAHFRTFFAIAASGFRRHATYRQATVAGAVTNSIFGFLRTYVLLAVVAVTGSAAGYDAERMTTYVWVGQGLLGVVMIWGWLDLAERIRSGDVVADLLRPIDLVTQYLATDVGRATHAVMGRFVPPVVVGAIFFDLYVPTSPATYFLFVGSAALAVVICFCGRYLVNATNYWLLDARGIYLLWMLAAGVLSGLYFPLRFLPEWLTVTLWLGTPFPSILQAPLDVLVERDPVPVRLGMVGVQVAWAVVMLLLCRAVQRRAERRLVIQGG
jgi:ABC-2 type transport system permease protein